MPRKNVKKLVTCSAKTLAAKPAKVLKDKRTRRVFTEEFRREAVAMLLDGHSAGSVAERLGLASSNVLYRWKAAQLKESGPIAESLEARVHELEVELARVTRERDILKKALVIFGRSE
jgi:transposase